jgi:hypothetical protein
MEKKAAFLAAFFSLLFAILAGQPAHMARASLSLRAVGLAAGSAIIQTQTSRLS